MLTKQELLNINGGAIKLTASLLNYVFKGVTIFTDLGRSIGSAIRRGSENKLCPVL